MRVDRLAEGLWRWTAGDADDAAACLYHEAPDGIVLADPIVPAAEAERFWRALDRDVERVGRPPTVAITLPSRPGSATAVRARYPGARILAVGDVEDLTPDARLVDGATLPGGVVAHVPPDDPAGALLTCACHAALWTGELLVGTAPHDLVPASSQARRALAPLAERLIATAPRIIVPARGAPIADAAPAALARALA